MLAAGYCVYGSSCTFSQIRMGDPVVSCNSEYVGSAVREPESKISFCQDTLLNEGSRCKWGALMLLKHKGKSKRHLNCRSTQCDEILNLLLQLFDCVQKINLTSSGIPFHCSVLNVEMLSSYFSLHCLFLAISLF